MNTKGTNDMGEQTFELLIASLFGWNGRGYSLPPMSLRVGGHPSYDKLRNLDCYWMKFKTCQLNNGI